MLRTFHYLLQGTLLCIFDKLETQDIISFAGRPGWVTSQKSWSISVVFRERVFRCRRRWYLWWVRVSRLIVVNFRHLVLARIWTPEKLHNIPKNAFFDALLMSGFQIFAADAAFPKPCCGWCVYRTQPRRMPCHSQIFARKPEIRALRSLEVKETGLFELVHSRILASLSLFFPAWPNWWIRHRDQARECSWNDSLCLVWTESFVKWTQSWFEV